MKSKRSNTPAKSEFGLHVLAQGINPVVDIIAIHGLDGHLEKSWTADNGTLWLRDLAPELIANARIITYGYDGNTRGHEMLANESIHDLGKHLLTCIAAERQGSGIEQRPIIFVVHSLGGIVLKSALITANAASSKHNRHHKAIEVSTHGIIFLGTPHQGGEGIDLALILLHIQSIYRKTNDAVLGDLSLHSKALQQQLDQYTPIGDRYETKFFYEVYATKLFAGKSMKLVDQHSAVVPGMQNAESIALNKDHVGIAKFGDKNDADFKVLLSHLLKMAEEAPSTVAKKWMRYIQHEELDLQQRAEGHIHSGAQVATLSYKAAPLSSHRFIGRLKYRERMKEYFGSQDDKSRRNRMFLLHGPGGMGKSEISMKYAEDHSDQYEEVFWLDATSAQTMKLSLQNISQMPTARAANIGDSPESVLQWIAELQVDWLMIFDNADNDPRIVTDNLPGGARGHIIITSRNPTLRQAVPRDASIEVDDMEENDAISLLLQSALLDDNSNDLRQLAAPIVKQLCCLPLAVVLAGASISSGQCSLADYLQTYSDHRQSLMSNVAFTGASSPSRAVYGTWDVSSAVIENIASRQDDSKESEAARSAIGILRLFGFMHHENISEEIFKRAAESNESIPSAAHPSEQLSRPQRFIRQLRRPLHKLKKHLKPSDVTANEQPSENILEVVMLFLHLNEKGHWDPIYFRRGIELLLSFSLIRVDVTGRIYSVHPLVHAWCRDRLSLNQQKSACRAAMEVLTKSIIYEFSKEDHVFRRALIPHISTEHSAEVRREYNEDQYDKFALALHENGYWEQSEKLLVQIMKECLSTLGAEHSKTLRIMVHLASTYLSQGRWKEAEELQAQVMETSMRVLGIEHSDTLLSIAGLASTYWSQGRWREAEQLQVQFMEISTRVRGAEHPETLLSMAGLASTYWSQGRWKEAERLKVQVMEVRTRTLGTEHPSTLESMAGLAVTYCSQDRWDEAEELQVQVMETTTRVLGVEHPDTLHYMADLAATHRGQGRWKEAEELQIQVMTTRTRVLGAEHSDTLDSMAGLAATYWSQERWKEAEALQVPVLELSTKIRGAEHPKTLDCMFNLAVTLKLQVRDDEALALMQKVVQLRIEHIGSAHPNTAKSIRVLESWQDEFNSNS